MREGRNLLRLLTILETMTNNEKVGSKVDLLNTAELTGFLPDLTRLGLIEELGSTKQLYLSRGHKGSGNAMIESTKGSVSCSPLQ